jgi:hypothetical protein
MKIILLFFAILSFSISVSAQNGNGYCFSASSRGSFEDVKATKFDKIKTNTEQTNIYTFSFNDNMLVHHIVRESGTICQFYKITDVEKINSYSYFISVVSGSSNSEYYYYLSDLESDFQFYQIDAIGDNDKMSGTKFGDFGSIDLIPFKQ